jgi:5'-3' exonuclease
MNRFFEEEIPDTYENRNKQITTLISILTCLPVCQIYTPDCEADDVIAYLCNYRFKNESKVIFSSDSDFYQLLDDNTEICTLTRNKWIKSDSVLQEFSVYPRNFCLLKAMKGDSADNIPGVKGAGFKTIIKRFPFIKEDRDVLIDEILKHSQDQLKSKIKLYQSVIDSEQDLRRNWRIMYLDSSFLTLKQIKKINDSIDSFSPKLKRLDVTRILIKEGLNTIDLSWLFFPMNYLISGEV